MPRFHRHSRASRLVAGATALLALANLPASTASAEAVFAAPASAESSANSSANSPGDDVRHAELLQQLAVQLAQADPLKDQQTAPPPPAAIREGAGIAPAAEPVENSSLDARLFYQLLIGEVELRSGEVGTAYEVLLDAARRTKDETLFKRVTDVALQARAGDQALAAARAWRTALPTSVDAHRYIVQLLVALNRPAETVEPLKSLLALTPVIERPQLITALPLFFGRSGLQGTATTTAATIAAMEQVLQPYMDAPGTRDAARISLARALLLSGDTARAISLTQQAHRLDPDSERPVLLALELMSEKSEAEPIVIDYLQRKPQSESKLGNTIRLVYARVLGSNQRYADAMRQLEAVTRNDPEQASPWLTLGALYVDLKQPVDADKALSNFVRLTQAQPATAPAEPNALIADVDDVNASRDDRLTQAYLLLAQSAEQRNDLQGAEAWLTKVDSPQRALEVQSRRASLLARAGKIDEGRELIRRSPERTVDDARSKLLAEAQLLRDAKKWDDAALVLASASQRFPGDADLIYEQAMVAEKQKKLDEMERLLRGVIEINPSHHHAYNALGYSLAERGTRLPEARDLIQKALSLVPGEPFITDSLGWVEYRMGNRDEALRLLRDAYRSRPDTEIGAHLGEVLWMSGQQDEARKVWREARGRDSGNDVLKETLARLRVDL